ncbi:MAG: hypothetical protein WA985_07530 [Erythrobacter sp.]
MRFIEWLLMGIALLGLSGCDDAAPDYRYRLTVEVETPEGLRSGSGVIEVEQSMGRSSMNPAGRQIRRRARGEAVAVDLPDGRTLYALLRSDSNGSWATYVMQMLAPDIEGEPWEEVFDNVLLIEGEVELPRTWPTEAHLDERSAYPMLVTFRDESGPTTVERVDPDDLAASFGAGYTLERITVQLTDDPVTTGIAERLGWLSEFPEPRLDPHFRSSATPNLSQRLWHGDFRKGTK